MATWTLMIYMAGDNNLSPAAEIDLAELRRVGSTADVRVMVEVDLAGAGGTRRLRIGPTEAAETATDLGETDSGDPESVLGFVRWECAQAPSARYGLILWNHGGGWEPAELDRLAAAAGTRQWSAAEGRERAGAGMGRLFFRGSVERILRLDSRRQRAICSDDGSGHSLDTVELGHLLANVRTLLGQPLDLLGMDACLMSTLEVAYQVRDSARYLVASQDNEPAAGWPYDRLVRALIANPAIATAELAAAIVADYCEVHAQASRVAPVTQSALDLQQLDALTAPLDALAAAAIAGMAARAPEIWSAQRRSTNFCEGTSWDLLHWASELRGLTADSEVAAAAGAVCAALAPGRGPVVAEAHAGAGVERCGGVNAYLPALRTISPYYSELAFARDHRWLEFVGAYQRALRPGEA